MAVQQRALVRHRSCIQGFSPELWLLSMWSISYSPGYANTSVTENKQMICNLYVFSCKAYWC